MASYIVCEVLCLIPVEWCSERQETHDLSDYDETNLLYTNGRLNIIVTSSLSKTPSLLYMPETRPFSPNYPLISPIITTCSPLEQNLKCKQNMP